jgi:hypothetical protein
MSNNQLNHNIKTIYLTTTDNVIINLQDLIRSINIYEDMYSMSVTGNIVIKDSLNLIENLSLSGLEIVHVEYSIVDKFGVERDFIRDFAVYKIGDREVVSDKSVYYQLFMTSVEGIIDSRKRISWCDSGNLVDDIKFLISDILGSFKGVLVGSSVESRSRTGPSVALRATLTPYSILRNLLKIHSSNSAPTLLFQGLSKSPSLGAFSALDNNHFQSRGITTQKSGETTQDVIQNTPKSGIIKEFPLGNSGENTQSIQNNIQGGGNTTQDDSYTSIYINQNFNLGNTSQGVQNTPKSVHNAQKSIVNTQKSGNTTQKIVHYPMFLWETSDGYRVEELNWLNP